MADFTARTGNAAVGAIRRLAGTVVVNLAARADAITVNTGFTPRASYSLAGIDRLTEVADTFFTVTALAV